MRQFSLRLLLSALVACGAALTAARADDVTATLFTFRHVVVDTSTANPSVCLRFSQTLNTAADAHYEDYLAFAPAVKVALAAAGTDLCISGLDAATDYKLTIRPGLPAASGEKLESAPTLDVALTDRAPLVAIAGDGFILPRATANGW